MVDVLYVKGSGGDLGSMGLDGFATLYLDKLLQLQPLYRGVEHEDDMVALLPHCTFNLNPRAASIDTPLHALLPFAHIDHVHPDAIIALAASSNGEAATREIYGDSVGLAGVETAGIRSRRAPEELCAIAPQLRGVMLAGHGIICWGETAKSCYDNTIDLIARAAAYLNQRLQTRARPSAAAQSQTRPCGRAPRHRGLAHAAPARPDGRHEGARWGISLMMRKRSSSSDSRDFPALAAMGTSCPDHFLRTKIAPLALDPERIEDMDYLSDALKSTG